MDAVARPRYFWTTAEEQILREHYPRGGLTACLPLLPNRSHAAIYVHAHSLGLHYKPAQAGRPRQKYFLDTFIETAIRDVYENHPEKNAVNDLARRWGRPRWWIARQARNLGLVVPRLKEPPWSPQEDALLHEIAHRHPEAIARAFRARGWRRSATAIVVRRKRLELDTTDPDHYTANTLARLMGVDAKVVTYWIGVYGLPAVRRGTERLPQQGGDQWWIARIALRRWIGANPERIDLRKVDRLWFIELLCHP